MLSVERPRKRPCSSSELPSHAIKRPRIDHNLGSLSSGDRAFISKAASNLQLPSPEVPATISNLSPPLESGDASYILTHQPEQNLQPPLGVIWSLIPEHGAQRSTVGREKPPTNNIAPTNIMYGPCLPDGYFGFARNPTQWAECLTGLVSFRHDSTNQPNFTDQYQYPLVSSDDGCSLSEKPFISCSDPDRYAFQPYSGSHREQTAQSVPGAQGGHAFACDSFATLPPGQSYYPVLQPTSVETTQPGSNMQHMIYSKETLYPAGTSWNQNADNIVRRARRYGTNQPYDSIDGESQLGEDQYSDDIEVADRTAAREGQSPSRRRSFQNPRDRTETAQTRKDKACLRCRMQRIRCVPDPYNPKGVCLTCQKVSILKISNLPCIRYKITEIRLFKPGQVPGLDWTLRWPTLKLKDISTWASNETRRIHTTEGFSSVPLELEVRKFVPAEGDVLERFWWTPSGVKKSVVVPPYAISNVNAARLGYEDYINRGGAEFFKGWLNNKDELLVKTYSAAIEATNNSDTSAEERLLLKMVLRLWVAIRITTRSIRICGEDTLGMPADILDETSPLHGEIPVPPVMGAQIELILIQGIQIPLRKQVLHRLQALISANKPNTWFTIYLCSFILLHNCAMLTKYDAGYAKKYGFSGTYARPSMVEECHTGANILLAYWHYCNKGLQPFTLSSSAADFHARSELKHYQANFIRETSRYVQARGNEFKLLHHNHAYEKDYFFVSQLYEQDWHPRISVI